jgi:hypothetical protein
MDPIMKIQAVIQLSTSSLFCTGRQQLNRIHKTQLSHISLLQFHRGSAHSFIHLSRIQLNVIHDHEKRSDNRSSGAQWGQSETQAET